MHGPTHNRGHTLDLLISRGLNISSIVIKDVFPDQTTNVLFSISKQLIRLDIGWQSLHFLEMSVLNHSTTHGINSQPNLIFILHL